MSDDVRAVFELVGEAAQQRQYGIEAGGGPVGDGQGDEAQACVARGVGFVGEAGADSGVLRNTVSGECCDELTEELSRGLLVEDLAGAVVEFGRDDGQVLGAVEGQVGAFREVLAQ